jgi:hypothetical protein
MEFIYEAHDVIPEPVCQQIIDNYERSDKKYRGNVGEGIIDITVKKSLDLSINEDPKWTDICHSLDRYVVIGINRYFEHLVHNAFNGIEEILHSTFSDYVDNTGYIIQKYTAGGKYDWHTDDDPTKKRLFGFIIYLNDVDKNCGGCTEFTNGRNIIPKAGKILFFPSNWTYPHRGQELKSGVKYIVTGFVFRSFR